MLEQLFTNACIVTLILSLGLLVGKLICGFRPDSRLDYVVLAVIALIMFAISWRVTDLTSAGQIMVIAFIGWFIGSLIDAAYGRPPPAPRPVATRPQPRYESDLRVYDRTGRMS